MRTNLTSKSQTAFLWDESFLWGIMAYEALSASGIAFDLVRSEDVRKGKLKDYSLLFVPGGWASNKMKALGDSGIDEIKRFVREGGSYIGFCGGAGLATLDGIGLVDVKRRPTKERVPSFSGPIKLNIQSHSMWNGLPEPIFNAWWPSQFIADQSVSVLATYDAAQPDSFSSDINVGDAETHGGWEDLERVYQINLDPKRLTGEPAVIEGRYGEGSVILSLVHFDTPDDKNGAIVLKNLWNYFQAGKITSESHSDCGTSAISSALPAAADEVQRSVSDLIRLGERNFLWYWRNPSLLQWRRGVRGLEYCTLYIMVRKIAERMGDSGKQAFDRETAAAISDFSSKAGQLLLLERQAMQNGNITYERCDDPRIQALRDELFSRSKSYGGRFKDVIDQVDGVLFNLLANKVAALD